MFKILRWEEGERGKRLGGKNKTRECRERRGKRGGEGGKVRGGGGRERERGGGGGGGGGGQESKRERCEKKDFMVVIGVVVWEVNSQ